MRFPHILKDIGDPFRGWNPVGTYTGDTRPGFENWRSVKGGDGEYHDRPDGVVTVVVV